MATRANIVIQLGNENEYLVKYSHWDGYPEGLGADLLKEPKEYTEILKIVSIGDGSYYDESYTDRGESWEYIKPRLFVSKQVNEKGIPEDLIEEMYDNPTDIEYVYLFTRQNKWYVYSNYGHWEGWISIEEAIDIENK